MLLQRSSVIFLCVLYAIFNRCSGSCYFPPELQGSYLTQNTVAENQVKYSEISITAYGILIWGQCHSRAGDNVLLKSSGDTECYRCFNLKLVSKNILRVITSDPDFMSKCYANEEKALASCPSQEILSNPSKYTKIILYKTSGLDSTEIRYEYCPINGRYKFNYNNDDGKEDVVECISRYSELDNCPSGSALNLRFKECHFENHELIFECLGHWTDLDGQNYLALVQSNKNNSKQYRCGIFEENSKTGFVTIHFSKDSTCSGFNASTKIKTHHPNSSDIQFSNSETLILYPENGNIYWPIFNFCKFPNWLQGEWQHITIKNDTLIFRDQISFKAYTMKCLENMQDTVIVYSRTQCDEKSYKCLKIKNRSDNVIEFQIGSKNSDEYNNTICSDEYFDDSKWLTQSRLNEIYSACPIIGVLVGVIPDNTELCANLSSDCLSEDIMFYEVSSCESREVFEERKYRCLGQWTEKNFTFTYTKRLDVGTYECFIGAANEDHTAIYIKEAGEHCQRNINPFKYGMELKQIKTCSTSSTRKTMTMSYPTKDEENQKILTTISSTTVRTTKTVPSHLSSPPRSEQNSALEKKIGKLEDSVTIRITPTLVSSSSLPSLSSSSSSLSSSSTLGAHSSTNHSSDEKVRKKDVKNISSRRIYGRASDFIFILIFLYTFH